MNTTKRLLALVALCLVIGLCCAEAAVYAVIVSGGRSKMYNHERYWNDCAFLYRTLRHDYALPAERITLLMADGDDPATDLLLDGATGFASSSTDLDGDGQPDLHLACTRQNLTDTFQRLASGLTAADQLLLFVVNHAELDERGEAFLWLWRGERLSATELAALLGTVQAGSVAVVLGPCYAGAFAEALQGEGRVVMAACGPTQLSWRCAERPYDEFVYHWTCAVARHDERGLPVASDADGDGRVSMAEAFSYARQHDRRPETPLLLSCPEALAGQLTLSGAGAPSAIGTVGAGNVPLGPVFDLRGRRLGP